eukprot:GEMP01023185.1.p1 GENE.GEMP01023185.1~~GEMP01023185.1.p1  ORF type:complete len:302 (+),score=67.80 GEMP01023185.1:23-907(+)
MLFCHRQCCGTSPEPPASDIPQFVPYKGRSLSLRKADKCKADSVHVELKITDGTHCVEECTSAGSTSRLEAIARQNCRDVDPVSRRTRKMGLNLMLSPTEKGDARSMATNDTRDSDDEHSEYYVSPKWTKRVSRILDDTARCSFVEKWYDAEDNDEEEKKLMDAVSSFAEDMMRGMWIHKLCANGNRLPRMCSLDRHLSSFIILLEGQLAEYPFSQMLEICRGYSEEMFSHYMPVAQRAKLPPPEVCATIMMASTDIAFVLPSETERDHFVFCMQTLRYQYLRRRKAKRATTLY